MRCGREVRLLVTDRLRHLAVRTEGTEGVIMEGYSRLLRERQVSHEGIFFSNVGSGKDWELADCMILHFKRLKRVDPADGDMIR